MLTADGGEAAPFDLVGRSRRDKVDDSDADGLAVDALVHLVNGSERFPAPSKHSNVKVSDLHRCKQRSHRPSAESRMQNPNEY